MMELALALPFLSMLVAATLSYLSKVVTIAVGVYLGLRLAWRWKARNEILKGRR